MSKPMQVRIIRGDNWESRDVTFECFDRGRAVLHWDGLNGSMVFWLNAGKGHIGGHGVDAPSWLIDAKDLQKLKRMYDEHKRASRKGKKAEATA